MPCTSNARPRLPIKSLAALMALGNYFTVGGTGHRSVSGKFVSLSSKAGARSESGCGAPPEQRTPPVNERGGASVTGVCGGEGQRESERRTKAPIKTEGCLRVPDGSYAHETVA